ncbi:glycoside hydrolase family 27 protein [Mucilaginibacter sp. 44-25]|uniref:glycoside hydrolase family 27 protein n=1 Tax=Mucilaginibacter sp. 44-25 TaxID=1895794 RepID=UPI000A453473|nr:glycoside hydrolase family 27 protein [Mucilaginibacter sp. 44-25]
MKPFKIVKALFFLFLIGQASFKAVAQNGNAVYLKEAKFSIGNDNAWADSAFNDLNWKNIKVGDVWQEQGYPDYHGFAWYRIHVIIPSSLKKQSVWGDSLRIFLAHVNDVDETYLNGKKIGKTGSYPQDAGGYVSKWPAIRSYNVAANDQAIKWDQDNVIAVKVYDGGGSGGIFMGQPYIDMLEKFDGISFEQTAVKFLPKQQAERSLNLENKFNTTVSGKLHFKVINELNKKTVLEKNTNITLTPLSHKTYALQFPQLEGIRLIYEFTENETGKTKTITEIAPYLLTPAPSQKPEFNGASVLGVHPGSPVIYKIAASGKKPFKYRLQNLPKGLAFDQEKGLITGVAPQQGEYHVNIVISNKLGTAKAILKIKSGKQLALTPPMGWNSWNCWGLTVSDAKVRSSANAMINKGLVDYGWTYINIDDGWQAPVREKNGDIVANEKFPDMKGLGSFLHQQGLKFGIYSSPGTTTCGGYMGSLNHEAQDATTYNYWGVDYLKYDLCSYSNQIAGDTSLLAQQKPYMLMRDKLAQQPRDIIYSLCQYGIKDVWKWGRQMNGNLWRTTEDITDTWQSLRGIGFSQINNAAYAGPSGWNDPDMLIVGQVGWGENLHQTHLTPYEQYTHMSLWCMLSAPLLIGCDMDKLDDFTLNLLKNREVIALDQDELGKQAERLINEKNIQVWVKPLSDGSKAIGIFNLADDYSGYNLDLEKVKINKASIVRDVWQQKNISKNTKRIVCNIPPHGVRLYRITS